ncbi:MAG: hypothetical protein ACK5Y2_09730 [Bdellovibrionales bacterium]
MKSALVFLLLFCGLVTSAFGHELSGTWRGPGLWIPNSQVKAVETDTELKVALTSSELKIEECWDYRSLDSQLQTRCELSEYEIRDEKIYLDGQRVGDVYPFQILVFVGRSQVSEQISLKISGPEKIRYRYTYVNQDGEADTRSAELKRPQKVSVW